MFIAPPCSGSVSLCQANQLNRLKQVKTAKLKVILDCPLKLYLVCVVVGITNKQTLAYLGEGKLHTTPVMQSYQEEKLI